MKETLTATFTNELGEAITYLYSLERMGPALKTAQTIEDFLLLEYVKYWAKRDKGGAIAAGQMLISLEVEFNEPGQCRHLFADGWEGKFQYDPKQLRDTSNGEALETARRFVSPGTFDYIKEMEATMPPDRFKLFLERIIE
jgi:hypothetical protein